MYYIFLLIFLGLMSAFGPFVTDMYLPTLPAMAHVFNASATEIQLSLSTSMLGLALGQIFFGPLSDKYGRKTILIFSMIIFCIFTIAALFSKTIGFFNLCRFIQGLGGAGGIVLSRSVAADCFSGKELAKTMALIGAINGIAPVTAPVIGGMVSSYIGWKGIFIILLIIGLVILTGSLILRESHPVDKRFRGPLFSLLGSFPLLLREKKYVCQIIIYAFAAGVLFSYIASASFIIQNKFSFSELAFALFFGVNAIGIGIGSMLAIRMPNLNSATKVGVCGITLFSILQLFNTHTLQMFDIYEGCTFLLMLCLGFIFTSTSTMAMEAGKKAIGAASAIFGAVGFGMGGIVSPLVGIGDIFQTSALVISISAIGGLICLFSIAKN